VRKRAVQPDLSDELHLVELTQRLHKRVLCVCCACVVCVCARRSA
jgi:hypothetical protein